jgi:CMP-N,N'-diacetyllegionaminic acid synthase
VIEGVKVVCLIPARGGSKSIHRKNLQLLGEKPLLAWPIETALSTPEIDNVFVSTDDMEIKKVAMQYGAKIHDRRPDLSTDRSIVADTVRDFWDCQTKLEHDLKVLVLLEATSPFRSVDNVSACIQKLISQGFDSVATFQEAEVNPERTWRIEDGTPKPFIEGSIPWKPRQLLSKAYQLNGSVYAFFPDRLPHDSPSLLFGNAGSVIMENKVIDIDTKLDLEIANALFRRG